MVVMYQCWFPDVGHCILVRYENIFEMHAKIWGSNGKSCQQLAFKSFSKKKEGGFSVVYLQLFYKLKVISK